MNDKIKLLLYNFESEQLVVEKIKLDLPEEIEVVMISTPIELTLFIKNNSNIFMLAQINKESEINELRAIISKVKTRITSNDISLNCILKNKTQSSIKIANDLGSKKIYETNTRPQIYAKDINNFAAKNKKAKQTAEKLQKTPEQSYGDYVTYVSNEKGFKQISLESGRLSVVIKKEDLTEYAVKLEHFEDELIEIEASNDLNLSTDENCEILIIFEYNRCKIEISLIGHAKQSEMGRDSKYITITTQKDEEIQLDRFFDMYQMRQKSISNFISLTRGY
jgi:hypothetical protein